MIDIGKWYINFNEGGKFFVLFLGQKMPYLFHTFHLYVAVGYVVWVRLNLSIDITGLYNRRHNRG